MRTLHLRFPDETTALGAFAAVTGHAVGALSEVPSKVEVNGLLCDVDVIGIVGAEFGEVDEAGGVIVGFRVNIWVPDEAVVPAALAPAVVTPVTPRRVFG